MKTNKNGCILKEVNCIVSKNKLFLIDIKTKTLQKLSKLEFIQKCKWTFTLYMVDSSI